MKVSQKWLIRESLNLYKFLYLGICKFLQFTQDLMVLAIVA